MTRGEYLLEAEARDAIEPCRLCDRTVPHAYEDPDSHTWDPFHLTVDPADVLRLIEQLRKCQEAPFG